MITNDEDTVFDNLAGNGRNDNAAQGRAVNNEETSFDDRTKEPPTDDKTPVDKPTEASTGTGHESTDPQTGASNSAKGKKHSKLRYAAGLSAAAAAGAGAAYATDTMDNIPANDDELVVENVEEKHNGIDESASEPHSENADIPLGDSNDPRLESLRDTIKEAIDDYADDGHTAVHADEIPAWSDGRISVATGDFDSMSFQQAFAAARAEVGAGGAFEWHGKVFGTYLHDEWQNMSPAEHAQYESHFSWSKNFNPVDSDDELDVSVVDDASEVEVLGVAHVDELDADLAVVAVDDSPVVMVDIDNDGTYDILGADIDGDGTIDGNELMDIADDGIGVSDLDSLPDSDLDLDIPC